MTKPEIKIVQATISDLDQLAELFDLYRQFYRQPSDVAGAKKFLAEPKYNDYNIEAIGFECGFNSKSAFYMAFKKFTNATPSEFKKQNN